MESTFGDAAGAAGGSGRSAPSSFPFRFANRNTARERPPLSNFAQHLASALPVIESVNNNPLQILQTLDRHLSRSFDLYVYGRSAIALGFPASSERYQSTMDVDAILPGRDLQVIEANEDFWRAQVRTNEELGSTGLYFTHLFEDRQVILTADWFDKVVAMPVTGLQRLRLFRPSTEDLVLTKMMRIDPEDREDIGFLLSQGDLSKEALQLALAAAVVPNVKEIREAFVKNREWLRTQHGV